ncbi:MAG: hypothetical protein QOI68_2226, partial [Pseudonocardiales bacterium]|nr:hypothetical protein [Pseudonocardiales bacterium]
MTEHTSTDEALAAGATPDVPTPAGGAPAGESPVPGRVARIAATLFKFQSLFGLVLVFVAAAA